MRGPMPWDLVTGSEAARPSAVGAGAGAGVSCPTPSEGDGTGGSDTPATAMTGEADSPAAPGTAAPGTASDAEAGSDGGRGTGAFESRRRAVSIRESPSTPYLRKKCFHLIDEKFGGLERCPPMSPPGADVWSFRARKIALTW